MKDLKLRNEIVQRMNEVFRELGARDAGDGFNIVANFFEKLAAVTRRFDSQEKFENVLDTFPEPTKAERLGIQAVLRFAPHLVRYGIVRLASELRAELPRRPGGRDQTFGPRQKTDVCRFIADKQAEGVDLHIAKKRAALHFRTSSRTIERVWENRKKKRPVEPTFRDALRLLKD